MAKEMKKTDAMEELRVYMVNTESIYNMYMDIVKEIVKSGKKVILGKRRRRMTEICRDAVWMYRNEFGHSVGRIGCNQIAAVGAEILGDEVNDTWDFYQRYGKF